MKRIVNLIVFTALLCLSCSALWDVQDSATITFTYDTNNSSTKNIARDIDSNDSEQNYLSVSLVNAETESIIVTTTEYFDSTNDFVEIQFNNLAIVGKKVYATLELMEDGTLTHGSSVPSIMKAGINYLKVTFNDGDDSNEDETINFNITLHFNNNEDTIKSQRYDQYDLPIILETPEQDGYSFEGWYSNEDLSGARITQINTATDNDFYAKWEALQPDEYAITIIAPNVTVTGAPTKSVAEQTVGFSITPYDGYQLVQNPVSIIDAYGNTITVDGSYKFSMPSSNVTITITTVPIEYTITYNLNGGTPNSSNPESYTIESNTITFQDPTRNGYTFEGWYDSSSKITQIRKGTTGNITLSAQWNAISYVITYYLNDGTNNQENPASYTIESNTTLQDPTRDGYTFEGWYEDAAFNGSKITQIASNNTGDKSLYAKWIQDAPPGVEASLLFTLNGNEYTVTGNGAGENNFNNATLVNIPAKYEGKDVTTIGNSAFQDWSKITTVIIPDSITIIEDRAFYNTEITSLTIPNSVETIGESAFYSCNSLATINFGTNVTTIGVSAFNYCTSLTQVDITTEVSTTINNSAFKGNTSLKTVTLGETVEWIGNNAFEDNTSLTTINIPRSITNIGEYSFSDCSSLTAIYIPKEVTHIGNNAFDGSSVTLNIEIEESSVPNGWNPSRFTGHSGNKNWDASLPY